MHMRTPRLTDSHSGSGQRGGEMHHAVLALGGPVTESDGHNYYSGSNRQWTSLSSLHSTCSTTVAAHVVPGQPLDGADDAFDHRSKVQVFSTGAPLNSGLSAKGLLLHR